jgi:hypothetical protein
VGEGAKRRRGAGTDMNDDSTKRRKHEGPPRLRQAFGAEREGFEPSIEVDPLCRFSKPVP